MVRIFQLLRFNPTPLPTVAALIALVLTGYLGHWQQDRASAKRAMQLEFDARAGESPITLDQLTRDPALRYRRALAAGEWHAPGQIFVDNQVANGVVGYHVITPMKLSGASTYVLVNRGWIARGSTYPVPPVVSIPHGQVSETGQLTLPTTRFLELSPQAIQGAVWQNLTIERYRNATNLDILPFVMLAQDAPTPLRAVAERPDARADKNVEYMLTWYSLAATTIVLWVVLNLKIVRAVDQPRTSAAPSPPESQDNAGES